MKYILKIDGMSCKNCVKHVTEALEEAEGVVSCKVDLKAKSAAVETTREFTQDELFAIIDQAGYELVSLAELPVCL